MVESRKGRWSEDEAGPQLPCCDVAGVTQVTHAQIGPLVPRLIPTISLSDVRAGASDESGPLPHKKQDADHENAAGESGKVGRESVTLVEARIHPIGPSLRQARGTHISPSPRNPKYAQRLPHHSSQPWSPRGFFLQSRTTEIMLYA
ncbi:MAG: hypothetical protein LQ345_001267 [Seirophora villosa]|nr:MAG: hypothetical protein LQ345_001267 [Seirophora villosa]